MTTDTSHFTGLRFMRLGMLALGIGMLFGVIGGFQFLFPEFLQELLFTKTRPMHVSMVVSWIFLVAIGGIYFYLPRQCNLPLFSTTLAKAHFWIFLVTGIAIIACYLSGNFGLFRSGLEERIAQQLKKLGVPISYESFTIRYLRPEKNSRYTPDFVLPNGIVIEAKGRFLTKDRQKHLQVKAQYPNIDIRFVFSNPNQRISKISKTTYAKWCQTNGFKYAKETIPKEWIVESDVRPKKPEVD